MSDIDPDKLKVAELRDELKARGLDTKGNKAALIARLKEALESDDGDGGNNVNENENAPADDNEEAEEPEQQMEQAEEDQDEEAVQMEDDAAAGGDVEEQGEEENLEEAAEEDAAQDEEQETNGDADDEEAVILGDEFQTIDEASQDDTEEGNTDKKRKRSRSPHDRRRSRSPRDRYRGRDFRRHSPPPRKVEMEDTAWESLTNFVFDRFDCDLNLRIDENNRKATPLTQDGFAFMWSGVRTMYGVKSGKVAYEVKVITEKNVDHLPKDEANSHVLRVGWSVASTGLNLGEEAFSYGYGGTGKASTESNFNDYGETFSTGDVITAYLDMDSDPVNISYSKNGTDLGVCFEIEKESLGDEALFPHFLTKNTEFECNFGTQDEAWFPLKEEYTFIEEVPVEDRVRGQTPPSAKEDCEVIMMVGLPGAGKSFWANKHCEDNPEKRYNVLGTHNIIEKMKVMGEPRKKHYTGRWDSLIDKATKCLNKFIDIAACKKRNYIIDQTNVYASARRRKMTPFEGFQRKAVVVLPTEEEFKNRVKQRTEEEGKEIPESAVLEMKANLTLPEEGQIFSSVEYSEEEPDKEAREKLIDKYRKEGRDALPPPDKRFRRDRFTDREWRGGNRRGGWRGGYDRERRGGGGYRGGYRGNNWRPYHERRGRGGRGGGGGGYRGSYRDDHRRRDDRYDGGSRYKGRGGYGGGYGGYSDSYGRGGWNSGWGGSSSSGYSSSWGGSGGYSSNWNYPSWSSGRY